MKMKLLAMTLSLALMTSFSALAMANSAMTTKVIGTTSANQVGQQFTLAGVETLDNTLLLGTTSIDLDADGVKDILYVIGDKNEFESYDHINLIAVNGKSNKVLNAGISE